jgi:hypothetical protein
MGGVQEKNDGFIGEIVKRCDLKYSVEINADESHRILRGDGRSSR